MPKPAADPSETVTLMLADDGAVPNNPQLPLILYRSAIDIGGKKDPAAEIERIFAANGWGDAWRNGIYSFTHFHSMIHEALGIAKGRARVRFGGKAGEELELGAGDVAVLPAGTGHQRLSASADFLVVGAYPAQGTYDLCRATPAEHDKAVKTILAVPKPDADPVYGKGGPLTRLWEAADR